MVAKAGVLPLGDALRATYAACVGIDDSLYDMKVLAGVNTAVTGVGTGLGVGATVTGIVKASTDKKIDLLEQKLEKLREINERRQKEGVVANNGDLVAAMDDAFVAHQSDTVAEQQTLQQQIDEKTKKSKSLGNWRTGLLAGNTVTNIAGAAIAGVNQVDDDLQTQIDKCKAAVKNLKESITPAKFNGEDVAEAELIVKACDEYNYVDISSINKRGKGAMISSIIGATTGLTGTVTSGVANTDKTRNDNTDFGKQKEKNLNTASNVLAGASTVASATATVFNATQISAIKKVASVAENCTGVLK